MPSGKKARAPRPQPEADPEETVEADETTAVESVAGGEETTSAVEEASSPVDEPVVEEAAVEEPVAKKDRRWNPLRRRKSEPEAAPVDAVAPAEEAVAEAEPVLVAHQPAGKRLKIAAAIAAALFVAGGAFLGATAQPVIANRALVETKLDIARTAANAITTLWSYTPENMDSLGERSARYLTGDFAFQYRKFIDSIVATNKQAQVTNTTSVLGTAVESVNQTEASAVVYTNSIATSPVSKNIPSLRYLSYRLEMTRDGSEWRITRMTTITTLDLTPQL
jgi:Mce-associated membrane protein